MSDEVLGAKFEAMGPAGVSRIRNGVVKWGRSVSRFAGGMGWWQMEAILGAMVG